MEVATKVHHTFSVSLKWDNSVNGAIVSSGKRTPIVITSPPEFGGKDTEWSPEHLLALSISSCYATTFHYFVKLMKVKVKSFQIEMSMEVEKEGAQPFAATRYILQPHIEFTDNPGQNLIDSLLSKAKRYCIISNSVKGEVFVEPKIEFVNA
jgi:organic hydroperoxide reductase OsmC/OhrA